jgi:serine/threonine-protein kinase
VPLTSTETFAARYRTVRRLGSGGMATVFLAEDERLGRLVAVKRLHGDSTEDIGRRFRREARLGASLNHPNIVAIYDIASDDEGVLIVMEYVDGRTLRDEIAAGPLPPERALPILRGVAAALDHAHGEGVVHRDVKPANILVRKDGHVKLADLGIASAAEQSRITKSGAVLGTAAYMSPERLDGRPGGPAADVYALAAVAFEVLCGRKAVEGATPMEVARRVVSGPPPDLRDCLADASAGLAEALMRGLAKDPADRPPTAGLLVKEIESGLAEERRRSLVPHGVPNPAGTASKRVAEAGRPRWLPAVLAIATLALVAAVIAITQSGGDEGSAERSVPDAPRTEPRAGGEAAPAPGAPEAAVATFYARAAAGDYAGAWALATPKARAQLGGFDSFSASQSTLESITFPKLKASNRTAATATVDLNSRAVHSDREDRCKGSIDLVASAGEWRLDAFHIAGCAQKRRK